MSMPSPPARAPALDPPAPDAPSWPRYRDRMIAAGRMTAAVRWAGLATPVGRTAGVYVVAERPPGPAAETVLDTGHAHDLRARLADARHVARWQCRSAGEVVVYTIPHEPLLPEVPAGG